MNHLQRRYEFLKRQLIERKITDDNIWRSFYKWKYNDYHGHVAGDIVLKKVAGILDKTFEGDDNKWAYRYGGEEFAIICTDCDKENG